MNKKNNIYKIVTAILLIAAALCAAFFWLTKDFSSDDSLRKLTDLDEGWYYYNTSGEKVTVAVPCKIDAESTLELFYDNTDNIPGGRVVATYAAVYDVEIYAGNTLIYRFEDNGREINDAVRGNIVCSGVIPENEAGNGIRLIYRCDTGEYDLKNITVSTANALIRSVFTKSLFCMIVSIAMLVLGLLAITFGTAMAIQKEIDPRIICIGLFLLACGAWCLTDSAFIHILAGYSQKIFTLDFYLFMLMPIPLAYFVLNTADMKKHKMLLAVPILYYINIAAQSLLAVFGVFTFFRMLYATHILMMFSGVVLSLYVLIREYRAQKKSEILLCIKALTSVGIIGIIAIFLYIFIGYAAYQTLYQTGLLLLMSVLLSSLLKDFMQSVRYRTEATVYKRLSEQDKLTKLDNRRSFDSLVEKMTNGSLKYENAALLFMDVNFLKKANDNYGHDFGDKLLVSAAQCIKNAFGSTGYCYRIGGDEFCCVILDPSCTESELIGRIDSECARFNRDTPLATQLVIACGCSFIKENGSLKTITQWKEDADSRMYKEKKRIKALI